MKAVYSKRAHLLADDLLTVGILMRTLVSDGCMHLNKVITYTFCHYMIIFIFMFNNICSI